MRTWIVALLSLLLLWAVLIIPAHFSGAAPSLLPLEIPIAVLGLVLLTRGLSSWWRRLIILCLAGLTLLRLADAGSRAAFGRAFSPVAEWHLVGQGWTLASRTIGRNEALLVVVGTLLALALVLLLLSYGLSHFRRLTRISRRRTAIAAALTLLCGLAASQVMDADSNTTPRVEALAELTKRYTAAVRAVADQKAFNEELAVDPVAAGPAPEFAALRGRDVIVLIVESYGRSWVDAERFRDISRPILRDVGTSLAEAGFSIASAWIEAPIRGGRSWLAQATMASGLALTNQARFDRLISTDRKSLHSMFRDAGWTSTVLLPVVADKEWVEGIWYDVDRFFDGPSLEFKGVPQGYVTMPDQFILTAFENKVRGTADKPLFATIGLLGTHAPWGPLVLPVDWDLVGDGSIFDGSHRFGKPNSWAVPEPVREMYSRSFELALPVYGEYVERFADDALILIIGDHQPASVIAGWAPDAAVPLHVISKDEALIDRLDNEVFTAGMLPAEQAPLFPMESLREWFATTFE